MNIFACDSDPEKAARALPDKLVVKMSLETAQLLSTALRVCGYAGTLPLYKATHQNHPCAQWARRTLGNFEWLALHGVSLANEYKRRYGREHASARIIGMCLSLSDFGYVPFASMETFPQCMPEEFRGPDPVEAYRRYLRQKPYVLTWKPPAVKPEWW